MTLLEYVQSLQEQGVTDMPDKVQEWKKKNQPKVEEKVIETPVEKSNEGKSKGAAEADANVAPVENSSSSTGASLLKALDKNITAGGEYVKYLDARRAEDNKNKKVGSLIYENYLKTVKILLIIKCF